MAEIDPASMRRMVDTLAGFGTRHAASDADSPTRGIGAARRWIEQELRSHAESGGGRLTVHTQDFEGRRNSRSPAIAMRNIFAVLEGSGPGADRHVVVLGHFDSCPGRVGDAVSDAPGADDNASGTAVVLELARVLADEELEATVVFLCTDGEEIGLLGAGHWVEDAADQGLDIRAALNCDIVGDPSGPAGQMARDQVRIFSEGLPATITESELDQARRSGSTNDAPSRQLARFVHEVAELHDTAVRPMLVQRGDRLGRGGDHFVFNDHGYPAIRFTEVFENFDRQHHDVEERGGVRLGDRPEFVDEAYLADVCRLNAATIVHLANAPSPPEQPRIVIIPPSSDTVIRWGESDEEDVVGYEVVVRSTTAPTWETTIDVGDAREITLDLSKDNHYFGVRAVDADGYRSVVAFPIASIW